MCRLQQSREPDTRCTHNDDSYGLNTFTASCLYCQQIRWEILPKGKKGSFVKCFNYIRDFLGDYPDYKLGLGPLLTVTVKVR